MGKTCCVPRCRGGYHKKKNESNKRKISIFSFPKDLDNRYKWERAIPRKHWSPSKWSGVCEKHFKEDDFVYVRKDSNKRREKKKGGLILKRLNNDAVPSIFPKCPKYFTTSTPNRRSGKATSDKRLENIKQLAKEQQRIHDENNKVTCLDDLLSKLDRRLLPSNVLDNKVGERYLFFVISCIGEKPTFSYCLSLFAINY